MEKRGSGLRFFNSLLPVCSNPVGSLDEAAISLAEGRLLGPGFAEGSPTSSPRGCSYAHV